MRKERNKSYDDECFEEKHAASDISKSLFVFWRASSQFSYTICDFVVQQNSTYPIDINIYEVAATSAPSSLSVVCVCFGFFFLTWDGWICGRVSIFHLLVSFFTLNWTVLKVEWKMWFLFLSLFHGFFHLVENPIEIVSWLWNIHGLCSESATRKKVGKQFIWIVELMFTWDAHRKASKPR